MKTIETVATMRRRPVTRTVRRMEAAVLCALSLTVAPCALAAWDVTIVASGSSSGGAWSGDTWTASASGATLLASEIETHLTNGPTSVDTGSSGVEHGDITVNGAIAWSANTLTLSAARDVDIEAALTGTGDAALSLAYGQGAVAAGNQAVYRIAALVTVPSNPTDPTHIANFTTTRGSDGAAEPRTVPVCPKLIRTGWTEPGCSFLDQTTLGAMTITYQTVEVNVSPDAASFIYLPIKSATATLYPYAMGVRSLSSGSFYFANSVNQVNYFDADGNILPPTVNASGVVESIDTTTSFHETSKTWDWGPVSQWGVMHTFFDTSIFVNGYYIKFQPNAGETGRGYQTISLLVTDQVVVSSGYSVIDYVINVLPPVPAVSAGNLALTASTPGNAAVTLTGTGALTLTGTSSNSALIPDSNIGVTACTAAGACALRVSPVAGATGDATITLTVTDAYYRSATSRFTVSVAAAAAGGGGGSPGSGSTTATASSESFGGGGAFLLDGLGLLILFFRRRQPR